MMIRRMWRLTYAWLLWFILAEETTSLQIKELSVPAEVRSGSQVILRCLYDVGDGGEPLYSLKWYKGSHEFFRHLPRENPPTRTFPWADFHIDADDTEPGRVTLRDVSADAEGSYKCEVSSEGPTFNTDFAVANLTVIDIVEEKLMLVQETPTNDRDRFGHKLRCTFSKSRPAATISWLIDGKSVSASSGRAVDGPLASLWTTVESTVEYPLVKEAWSNATCMASLGNIYQKKTSIQRPLPPASDPSAVAVAVGRGSQPSMAKIAGSQSGSTSTLLSSAQIFNLLLFFFFFFFY